MHNDAIWRHRTGSTFCSDNGLLVCLVVPSHYYNQCWLIISKVPWHSSDGRLDLSHNKILQGQWVKKEAFGLKYILCCLHLASSVIVQLFVRNQGNTTIHDDVIRWKHFPRYWPFGRGIPLTKASDAELWCFLWSAPEKAVEQTIDMPVISDAIVFIMTYVSYVSMYRKFHNWSLLLICNKAFNFSYVGFMN